MSIEKTLPMAGKTVVLRGMTGHEEDVLTDEKKSKKGETVNEILKGCVLEIDGEKPSVTELQEMWSNDRTFCMVEIRKESYGTSVEIESTCQCKTTTYADVDLDELELVEFNGEEEFIEVIDGKQVTLTFMKGKDEKKLLRKGTDPITTTMLLRIKEVEGVHPNGVKKWLKDLPVKERQKLRKTIEEREAGYTTLVNVECEECGRENKVRVESQSGFFFPQN